MSEWEPKEFSKDKMVNAVLNVAASLSEVAGAVNGLLYGLKYSRQDGMSIAEAIEVGLTKSGHEIAEGLFGVAEKIKISAAHLKSG